ncbi:MAG: response regulator [Gemmatimonadota bacterium]|nr:response regulator [Gemmatimonadota bacterium]
MATESRTVLIVEDNYIVAAALALTFGEGGFTVLGPAASLDDATRHATEGGPDCAVLDINVRGGSTVELGRSLVARGIPVVFVSGYGEIPELHGDDDPLLSVPRVTKPADPFEVLTAVSRLLDDPSPVEQVP